MLMPIAKAGENLLGVQEDGFVEDLSLLLYAFADFGLPNQAVATENR
jgi:hypothetical protein